MSIVYLALGSNVGNRAEFIHKAIGLLSDVLTDIKVAPIYESKAVGYTDQADFLNTAVKGETDTTPLKLLKEIKKIEEQLGRVKRFRWGPREIDIDIICYGDLILNSENLITPHPRCVERDFVLKPLSDLNPELVIPGSFTSVKQLLDGFKPEFRSIIGLYGKD